MQIGGAKRFLKVEDLETYKLQKEQEEENISEEEKARRMIEALKGLGGKHGN